MALLTLLSAAAEGGDFHTRDPLRAFVRGDYAWGDDYFIHGADDTILFRCVLHKGRDGVEGVALSEVSIWGNHGGPWEVFRKTKKDFVYAGSRDLSDTACLESCRSKEYLASGRCRWQRGWPEGAARSPRTIIDTMSAPDLSSAPFECDCEFYVGHVDGDTIVFATRSHRTRAFAKIDGQTRSLHLVTKRSDADCRKGRRFSERWSDGAVTIGLDGVVTAPGAEACWYRGKMSVTGARRGETIAVTGSCGC